MGKSLPPKALFSAEIFLLVTLSCYCCLPCSVVRTQANLLRGFPGGSVVKSMLAKQGMPFRSLGKIPWNRKWQPTPVLLPGKPRDRGTWWATVHGVTKELDRTLATKQQQNFLHRDSPADMSPWILILLEFSLRVSFFHHLSSSWEMRLLAPCLDVVPLFKMRCFRKPCPPP